MCTFAVKTIFRFEDKNTYIVNLLSLLSAIKTTRYKMVDVFWPDTSRGRRHFPFIWFIWISQTSIINISLVCFSFTFQLHYLLISSVSKYSWLTSTHWKSTKIIYYDFIPNHKTSFKCLNHKYITNKYQ